MNAYWQKKCENSARQKVWNQQSERQENMKVSEPTNLLEINSSFKEVAIILTKKKKTKHTFKDQKYKFKSTVLYQSCLPYIT